MIFFTFFLVILLSNLSNNFYNFNHYQQVLFGNIDSSAIAMLMKCCDKDQGNDIYVSQVSLHTIGTIFLILHC